MRTRARLREWDQAFGQLICLVLRDLVVVSRLPLAAFCGCWSPQRGPRCRTSACVMFTAVGRTSTKLFSPLGYLESPSAANDAVGWIFSFLHRPVRVHCLSDLLDTIEDAASLGTPVQAEAVIGLEQAEAQRTAARAKPLAAFSAQQGHQADGQYAPAAWPRAVATSPTAPPPRR